MKLGVIGTGHVGLVTAATLATLGHDVMGYDTDIEKIGELQQGKLPFYEPGLGDLIRAGAESGRLHFSTVVADAVAGAEAVFLCVGTPPRATGEANLVAVEEAARSVATHATGPVVVIEKSTVPAGTAERLHTTMRRERGDVDIEVASNPEFLREGHAVQDSLEPDRILVGAASERAFEVLRRIYQPLTDKGYRLIETDITTAEISKHASNAFLAMKISFANALARLCEIAGGDVVRVTEVLGADRRIGPAFLGAGIGYGGYCFPKDLQAFERLAASLGYEMPILKEIARINDEAIAHAVRKVEEAVWNLEGKRVVLLGLSYKPDTDDVRFSPALALGQALLERGARVVGYDPEAGANAKSELPGLEVVDDVFAALDRAHCAILCTEWDEFRVLDLAKVRESMAYPVVVDGRNIFDPDAMRAAGFTYYPTGRPSQSA